MQEAIITTLTRQDLETLIIDCVKVCLEYHPKESNGHADRQVLSLADFCQYTGIGKQTAYRLTSRGEVPHSKRGKRLYFDKAQVDAWLLANHVGGSAEADRKANEYVLTKRRAKRA